MQDEYWVPLKKSNIDTLCGSSNRTVLEMVVAVKGGRAECCVQWFNMIPTFTAMIEDNYFQSCLNSSIHLKYVCSIFCALSGI